MTFVAHNDRAPTHIMSTELQAGFDSAPKDRFTPPMSELQPRDILENDHDAQIKPEIKSEGSLFNAVLFVFTYGRGQSRCRCQNRIRRFANSTIEFRDYVPC